VASIDFNGGEFCIEPFFGRGDINLNGLSNEIGDVVLFGNLLMLGPTVLDTTFADVQLWASEINCDDISVTTVDMAYLWDIIVGDLPVCDMSSQKSTVPSTPYATTVLGPTPSELDTMRIVSTFASVGDTFAVDFYLRNVDTLGVYNFRLRYDPAVMEPLTDTTIPWDSTVFAETEQLRGTSFDMYGAGLPAPGILTFLASDADHTANNLFTPGTGVAVRMSWRVLPSASSQVTMLGFESDPEFPHTFNTLADIRAEIWKRPVLKDGIIFITNSACDCPHQGDIDLDGFITAVDLALFIDCLFACDFFPQDPDCPVDRFDLSCDGFGDAVDLAWLIDHLFAGGPGPCDPCAP
jgi:hypothetical protein